MELDESALALSANKSPGVNTEALHHSIRPGDGSIRQDPHGHGRRLWAKTHPVPRIVVSGLRLRNFVVRLGLQGVDQVRELDRVLNEEDGDVCEGNRRILDQGMSQLRKKRGGKAVAKVRYRSNHQE